MSDEKTAASDERKKPSESTMNRPERNAPEQGKSSPAGARSRLSEITSILRAHGIMHGITPVKLREILVDLGPTYIKLGQIMSTRSDILPKEYCDELMKLRSDVDPMPFSEVLQVIGNSYGTAWDEIFEWIDPKPLGSASIAQVHRARLRDGSEVVVKVQRPGIYETMKQDITLMHRAVRLIPSVRIRETLNLDMILDELWVVAQEEMNFLQEAANMEQFAERNRDIKYFHVPRLHRRYTTEQVLVMEYIDGFAVDDRKQLLEHGYDLEEIGTKLVDNFMKQVMDDGFFHADPHPGNVCIRGGKIVWMDMGMMGRLTDRDRELITQAVQGIAANDTSRVQDAVMGLGEFRGEPNRSRLYQDLKDLMGTYFDAELGNIDIAAIMQDLMEIMKKNGMTMPHGLTMLARGLTQLEGVLLDLSPDISIMDIAVNRMRQQLFTRENLKQELKTEGMKIYLSAKDLIELPTLAGKILREYQKGQTRINLDLHSSDSLTALLHHLVRNLVIGLCLAGLFISSSIICTTDMMPQILGIPALGALGYFVAVAVSLYVVFRYLLREHRRKKRARKYAEKFSRNRERLDE